MFIYLFPNLVGFATGMAFARMFELSASWYIWLGIIGSVVIGAMHGHISGTLTFKAGLIRNAIVTATVALFMYGIFKNSVVAMLIFIVILVMFFL